MDFPSSENNSIFNINVKGDLNISTGKFQKPSITYNLNLDGRSLISDSLAQTTSKNLTIFVIFSLVSPAMT